MLLEKPQAKNNELARVPYSGCYHSLKIITRLANLLWIDGANNVPSDYCCDYIACDDKTINDHFLDMLNKAEKRGLKPTYVLSDSWHGSVASMKAIDRKGWITIANSNHNRQDSQAKGACTRTRPGLDRRTGQARLAEGVRYCFGL